MEITTLYRNLLPQLSADDKDAMCDLGAMIAEFVRSIE